MMMMMTTMMMLMKSDVLAFVCMICTLYLMHCCYVAVAVTSSGTYL